MDRSMQWMEDQGHFVEVAPVLGGLAMVLSASATSPGTLQGRFQGTGFRDTQSFGSSGSSQGPGWWAPPRPLQA